MNDKNRIICEAMAKLMEISANAKLGHSAQSVIIFRGNADILSKLTVSVLGYIEAHISVLVFDNEAAFRVVRNQFYLACGREIIDLCAVLAVYFDRELPQSSALFHFDMLLCVDFTGVG